MKTLQAPPMIVRVRIEEPGEGSIRLWLPLFLLWPLLIVILLVLSPLILIAMVVVTVAGQGPRMVLAIGALWELVCASRGLKVDVESVDEGSKVFVEVL